MRISEHRLKDGVRLTSYIHENIFKDGDCLYSSRPGIVVFPGGGYVHLSKRETEPIVLEFLSRGYQLFVLEYSVGEGLVDNEPEKEGAEAISWIRENAKEFDLISDELAVMGFSAGAHAAYSLCCHWEKYGEEARPDAALLCYPVITMGRYCHEGSKDNITKGSAERVEYFSLENQVTSSVPPTFVWHTTEDSTVPPMNTILLAEALERAGAVYEYHLYRKGKHGLSTCRREVNTPEKRAERWMEEADSWLKEFFGFVQ